MHCSLFISPVGAQTADDPVIMKVANTPVLRSEFEYSYNKNNAEGVIDKKTVEEYVDLFVNYKLKVQAALDAKLDTMKSFRDEFATYRDQQVRPSFITNEDVEAEARSIYDRTQHMVDSLGGLIHPSHILLMLEQNAPKEADDKAKVRIDSIYGALKNGADFAELARKLSDDKGSAQRGGDLGWIQPRQTVKEFEDAAYALQPGEMSKPVKSPFGYHIILMQEKRNFYPYDTLRTDIYRFIDQRNIREQIVDRKLADLSKESGVEVPVLLERRANDLSEDDMDLRYLIREYHDGLLLFEISNRHVWEKSANDEAGLKAYFEANRSKYKWDEPRYKGMAYHVKDKKDVKAVKKAVKGLPFSEWAEKLRTTFNNDSIIRIRVEKGIFKPGDHALIDQKVFKRDTIAKPVEGYPIDAVYGKKLKKGPEEYTDVRGLVTEDYREMLEKQWVEELRKRYTFTVYPEVLATVNKH
ncbi:MAG: peptidylprolyl isomerase [Prevotella sp.]|nr:peptidylprolyl isomerase [Prevotella sp.]